MSKFNKAKKNIPITELPIGKHTLKIVHSLIVERNRKILSTRFYSASNKYVGFFESNQLIEDTTPKNTSYEEMMKNEKETKDAN